MSAFDLLEQLTEEETYYFGFLSWNSSPEAIQLRLRALGLIQIKDNSPLFTARGYEAYLLLNAVRKLL